jgi:hypothetical protein
MQASKFQLLQRAIMSPRRFFGREIPFDMASYFTPICLDDHPNTRSGKNIQRNKKVPTTKHSNNCTSVLILKGCLRQVTIILHLGFGCIITLDLGVVPKIQQYMITIGSFLDCSCPYFKEMVTKALGKQGQWPNCKHLYFIFIVICGLNPDIDDFMHASSFSFNEVKRVLLNGILNH